jgi:hypothetical protein
MEEETETDERHLSPGLLSISPDERYLLSFFFQR